MSGRGSKGQIARFHVEWSHYCAHAQIASGKEENRAEKLAFVSSFAGKPVNSTTELTSFQLGQAIDALVRMNGGTPRVESGRDAYARGTAGRRRARSRAGVASALASGEDVRRILDARRRMLEADPAWNYDRWMESKHGPLGGRSEIRTQKDANKVWWALKMQLKRRGAWEDRRAVTLCSMEENTV